MTTIIVTPPNILKRTENGSHLIYVDTKDTCLSVVAGPVADGSVP